MEQGCFDPHFCPEPHLWLAGRTVLQDRPAEQAVEAVPAKDTTAKRGWREVCAAGAAQGSCGCPQTQLRVG